MHKRTLTVLILDDDQAVRESLVYYFEDRGWLVFPAENAEDALETLSREEIKGAVVDIRLPGMDGNDFIRIAKNRHPNLAFVICTGSPEYKPPSDIFELSQMSEIVFSKPVQDMSEIELTLRQLIDNSR